MARHDGVGEEVGWRGFALPHLQRTHGALAGGTLLAVISGAGRLQTTPANRAYISARLD